MELRQILKNISYLASTRFFQLIAQIIRAKVNAVLVGAVGIGIYNQLNTFALRTAQFSQLRVNEVLVKQIAENKNNESSFSSILSSLKAYILIVTGILIISLIVVIAQYIQELLLVIIQ